MLVTRKTMTDKQKQAFSKMAIKMRGLKGPEKNRYLYELDEYAKDCQVREFYNQPEDSFFSYRLACRMYYSLEGKPYAQPEFVAQASWQDRLEFQKFEALHTGITAYTKASNEEKNDFKQSVLSPVCPVMQLVAKYKDQQK